MAIDPITETVSDIPLLRKRDTVNPSSQVDKDDFVTKYEATNDHLANNTVIELNTLKEQINTTTGQISTAVDTVVAKEALMSPHYAAIDTVAANVANINLVVANEANINLVAANETNINSVANNKDNIDTVANNDVNINLVVTDIIPNITEILQSDDNANTATTKASEASDSALLSEQWATSETLVDGVHKGAKGYTLESKEWAISETLVDGINKSAKGYALVAQSAVASLPDGTVNDAQTTPTNTWSASKIRSELDNLDVSLIATPTITSPLNGAVDFTGTITKSAFATAESYTGVLDFAHWQLSYTSDFASIEQESTVGNLETWTPSVDLPLQECFIRVKDGSDGHRSGWCPTITFTTPNIYVETPTLTVTGEPSDVPETPTLTTGVFSVYNGSDTHTGTTFTVKDGGTTVWTEAKTTGDLLTTTVPVGILEVSKEYTFEAYHTGATYGNSGTVINTATTKSAFAPEQGQKGFGIEPFPLGTPYAALGLAEMTGTNDVGHDNYGNYIHTNGSIICHYIKKYYRVGHIDAPQYAIYGANSLEMVPMDTFADEATANAAGWALHRSFIDGGSEKSGFIRDKYLNSKKVGDTNVAVSVKNGNPIGLTTNATYTPSSTMTGCTGILADAVTLSRARGAGWNNESVFMVGWSAMISIAQAQRATNTSDVAWYDAALTTNFPKGCNNGSRADVNDVTVTWTASPDIAAKGLTGSASTFAKSTDNGANNGCADVNGLMYQVALGMTNAGGNATDSAAIATNTLYVLKKSSYLKDLTAGWNAATDAWGNAGSLATRYDAVTSPITISTSSTVYWGNGVNQVLSPDTSGVAHDLCGFLPKNDAATGATGTSQFGNDRIHKYNIANMYPYTAGGWSGSADAGVFYRYLNYYRSNGNHYDGFRAAAYVS